MTKINYFNFWEIKVNKKRFTKSTTFFQNQNKHLINNIGLLKKTKTKWHLERQMRQNWMKNLIKNFFGKKIEAEAKKILRSDFKR